jgi:hypothetical protein
MPIFETPDPIVVTLELGAGNVRITASDRTDTAVDVRPSNGSDESDVQAAQQVRVDHGKGTLQVIGPRARAFDLSRRTGSVEVSIDVPSGSRVSAELQAGDVSGAGRLDDCRIKTGAGNVALQRTGPLRVDTGAGRVTADVVAGNAETRLREDPDSRGRGHRGREELQR